MILFAISITSHNQNQTDSVYNATIVILILSDYKMSNQINSNNTVIYRFVFLYLKFIYIFYNQLWIIVISMRKYRSINVKKAVVEKVLP